jgi:hypothetical protein
VKAGTHANYQQIYKKKKQEQQCQMPGRRLKAKSKKSQITKTLIVA